MVLVKAPSTASTKLATNLRYNPAPFHLLLMQRNRYDEFYRRAG
jgi:hypothetical protein